MEERNIYEGEKTDSDPGGMIMRIRKDLKLSREKMAEGICSVQKYSRIEAGIDRPTELEFSCLMNRLGEPGLYYSDLYTKGNSECLALRALIREEAMLGNWDKATEHLCSYSQLFPPASIEDRQFLGFYETVHCYLFNDRMDGYQFYELCRDLLIIGRPDLCSSLDISFMPTQSEFLLMNAVSVGLSESGNPVLYEKAHSLLLSLLIINKKRFIPTLCRNTRIGLLLNLCLIESENCDYFSAERNLDILFQNFEYAGGSHLFTRALMCKAELLDRTGRGSEAAELRHSMYSVFHTKSEKSDHKVLVF